MCGWLAGVFFPPFGAVGQLSCNKSCCCHLTCRLAVTGGEGMWTTLPLQICQPWSVGGLVLCGAAVWNELLNVPCGDCPNARAVSWCLSLPISNIKLRWIELPCGCPLLTCLSYFSYESQWLAVGPPLPGPTHPKKAFLALRRETCVRTGELLDAALVEFSSLWIYSALPLNRHEGTLLACRLGVNWGY